MKEDIVIPKVRNVYMAIVREENKEFRTQDWNAYLINDRESPIDTVLIVSKGFDEKQYTSTMRHSLEKLPPQSFAKVEFLQDEVLKLNNEFSVSFFSEGEMFHKKFVFKPNSINENALEHVPVMERQGVLIKS